MKQYIKAEFALMKKNRVTLVIGFFGFFVYLLLLLFSGFGVPYYVMGTSIVGYVVFLFFMITLYFSPASYWMGRQKIVIPTENIIRMLGESKRTYLKIRLLALAVMYFGMVSVIGVMQIPAALIAGSGYSLYVFGVELLAFTTLLCLNMAVMFIAPARSYMLVIPGWAGFCGGFVGGLMGIMGEKSMKQVCERMVVVTAVTGVFFGIAVLYRYLKTVAEERGGLFERTDSREDEKR